MTTQVRKNVLDMFIDGARRGFTIATTMSMGGAVGVAASLATAGALTGHDVTVLLPAMYLMGNPVQNVGRCLGTAEVNAKYYPHIITVCVINALLSIWVMQLIV